MKRSQHEVEHTWGNELKHAKTYAKISICSQFSNFNVFSMNECKLPHSFFFRIYKFFLHVSINMLSIWFQCDFSMMTLVLHLLICFMCNTECAAGLISVRIWCESSPLTQPSTRLRLSSVMFSPTHYTNELELESHIIIIIIIIMKRITIGKINKIQSFTNRNFGIAEPTPRFR